MSVEIQKTKDLEFAEQFEERKFLLKQFGVSDSAIKMIKTSVNLQRKFLSNQSVINWLDDSMLKSGIRRNKITS